MVMNVFGLIGWSGAWVMLLGLSLRTPNWVLWIFMPYFIYGPYRVLIQLCCLPETLWMRRILQNYPWQILRCVPHGLTKRPEVKGRHYGWFEFPNPSRPDHWIPLVFARHFRGEWWARRMAPRAKPRLKIEIETLWFAGDPRFVGLIGVPTRGGTAPRRMRVIEQRTDAQSDQRFNDWDATAEDIERGRRAGVRPALP